MSASQDFRLPDTLKYAFTEFSSYLFRKLLTRYAIPNRQSR